MMVLSLREARALLIAPLAAVALASGFLLPLALPGGRLSGIVLSMTVTGTIGGVIAAAVQQAPAVLDEIEQPRHVPVLPLA